ncbi:MAG: hydroxymethylbilane synthase [bacterium]|nr:hydroxymethylbilane synthase [bacterium]MDY4099261.1 hydroxymethylbilane synthase [Lachnospiraceae bacterium]
MRKVFRIGSRESALAVAQAQYLMDHIRQKCPMITPELVTMKTTGDRILDRSLDQVGGKGLFVKELEQALLDGRIDACVHSLKDVPMDVSEKLPILGFSAREDARDVLVLPQGETTWDRSKPIGTSSARRSMQLHKLYPEITVLPVRGNVQTRLKKLDNGEFGAVVLAAAGLKRLGLEERITRYFSPEELLPAAGQGILAVQGRAGEDYSFLDSFFDADSCVAAEAERAFVRELDGGCSSPIAAYAKVNGEQLILYGFCDTYDGSYTCERASGSRHQAEQTGIGLARYMRDGL